MNVKRRLTMNVHVIILLMHLFNISHDRWMGPYSPFILFRFWGIQSQISWSNQLIMRTSNIKVHEEFSNSSIYVQYSVCTSSGYNNRSCQFMNFYSSKLQVYHDMYFFFSKFQIYYYMNKFQIYYFRSRFQNYSSQLFCLFRRWVVIPSQSSARLYWNNWNSHSQEWNIIVH